MRVTRGAFGNGAVLVEIADAVAMLTLNRPDQGNSLNTPMFTALHSALDWLQDREYRVLLICAEGKRFCVGGAIDTMQGSVAEALKSGLPIAQDFIRRVAQIPVPVISAVQGAIGGGGIGLAFCADLVIASDCMRARAGYVRIGLTPDVGSSWVVTRRIGPQRAMLFFSRNRDYSAQDCLSLGLVAQVVPQTELRNTALDLALELAQGPTGALAGTKRLIAQAMISSLEQQLSHETAEMLQAARLYDAQEGVTAFMEKRTPIFRGK